MLRSVLRLVLLLSIALIATLVVSACSLVPDFGNSGGDSGQNSDTGQRDGGAKSEELILPTNLAGLGGNVEACLSVTAVVVGGGGLVLLSKVGGAKDSLPELQKLVREAMAKVPSEVKGDLAQLLKVLDESGPGAKSLDDEKFRKAMEPVSTWLEANCKGK
ncbi:hypothetical protein [Arthrobacter sp. E3]|uniref:hypothetical protein n=1 Tax=Arthrobacter sp. E3 TaxID=517402 RepID=UPI001A946E29|nr:hypothetical protein [Arthrobacter sp. E3]